MSERGGEAKPFLRRSLTVAALLGLVFRLNSS